MALPQFLILRTVWLQVPGAENSPRLHGAGEVIVVAADFEPGEAYMPVNTEARALKLVRENGAGSANLRQARSTEARLANKLGTAGKTIYDAALAEWAPIRQVVP